MNPESIVKLLAESRNWTRLARLFDELFPDANYVSKILSYLGDPDAIIPSLPAEPNDKPVLDGLQSLKVVIDWTDLTVREGACRRSLVSPASDELLLQVLPETWTYVYLLYYVLLGQVRPSKRSAVVVAMRDDGLRIVEWVAHYRALGFDGIFIYSNDNRDDSDGLLACLAAAGVITFIQSEITGEVSPIRKAQEHSLWKLPELRQFRWVLYVDSDEFLRPTEASDYAIPSVIDDTERMYPDKLPSAICYHWKWFVSGRAVHRSDAILLERFRHSTSNGSIKTVVLLRDVLSMRRLHFPLCKSGDFFVDSSLRVIPESLSGDQQAVWNYVNPQYAGGQLNHYWAKSFQEFVIKKRRGDAVANTDNKREFEQFFLWNGMETEDNSDPCPDILVSRVLHEMAVLRAVDGVRDAERRVSCAHEAIFTASGGAEALHALYSTYEPYGYGAGPAVTPSR